MTRKDFYRDPAGNGNGFAGYLLGLPAIIIVTLILQAAVTFAGIAIAQNVFADLQNLSQLDADTASDAYLDWVADDWARTLTILSLSVGALGLAVLVTVRIIHWRPAATVLAVGGRFEWRRVAYGFGLYSLILLPIYAIDLSLNPNAYEFTFQPQAFVLLLLLAIPLLFIQTASEEIAFRGYLGQFMGAATRSRVWIVLIPSLLFAAAHLANPEVAQGWYVLFAYFYMGLFWALVSLRDQGIELAMGSHFANNLWISLLINQEGAVLETPAIFTIRTDPSAASGSVPIVAVMIGSALLPALFWLSTFLVPPRHKSRRA